MPELPEVQTTVSGLERVLPGLAIRDVWTDYGSPFHKGKDSIKDAKYFKFFKKEVVGARFVRVTRRAKNVLMHIEKGKKKSVILVHMKMTGHLLYGDYDRKDPFNRFIHLVFKLSNGTTLEMSDMRKFAKVTLIPEAHLDENIEKSEHLSDLGPEPFSKSFTFKVFKGRLGRLPNGRVKTVLMNQEIIAGVGNIYSDEALWRAGLNPEERVKNIPDSLFKKLFSALLVVLRKGIDFGGDSMSDYRNIHGREGHFQEKHQAYRRTGERCPKPGCKGHIIRKKVGGRSAHFCDVHQRLLSKKV